MLDQMLKETVDRFPQRTAVVFGESRITYHELYNRVQKFSQGLTSIGVQPSDCVALVLPNCPEFVISFYGVARSAAIALLLNPSFKKSELEHYIRDTNARVIVTDLTRSETCAHLISQLDRPVDLVVVGGEHPSGMAFEDLLAKDLEDCTQRSLYEGDAVYQYSSGSTGKPKRVCRTQKNIFHEANNIVDTLNITESDNILCIVPLHHAYGFGNCLLAATHSGATLVILEPCVENGKIIEQPLVFRQARVLELIEQEKITILPAVPYIYSVWITILEETPADLSTLRLCIASGNFLSKELYDKFYTQFGIPIRQLYGCTEAGSVVVNMQSGANIKYDSIGLPMKNVEIEVMDEGGQVIPPGVEGEVAIKSQTQTRGYYNAPDVNKEVFRNGYFFTGDLGKKDEEGYLYLTGRKKFIIDTGGYKVNPFDVESVLAAHPKVKEVVVVGVASPDAGQLIKAVVVPIGECPEQELFDYCRDKLADFKLPQIIEFREELPKSLIGKILRQELEKPSEKTS
jgi:long-chain acyl-CoA synthetase